MVRIQQRLVRYPSKTEWERCHCKSTNEGLSKVPEVPGGKELYNALHKGEAFTHSLSFTFKEQMYHSP